MPAGTRNGEQGEWGKGQDAFPAPCSLLPAPDEVRAAPSDWRGWPPTGRTPATSHHPSSIKHHTFPGFTLIEILAVLTVITIFAGVIGFSFRGSGSETVGLQSAQSTLASLHSLARSKAAVEQANAAVFVYAAKDDPEQYLRYLLVAYESPAGTWTPVGQGAYLPRGVYVVPDPAPSGAAIEDGAVWTGIESTVFGAAATYPGLDGTWFKSSTYTPRGTTTGSGKLLIATGRSQPVGATEPFVFLNPQNVRGISLSVYGGVSMLNSTEDF